MLPSEYALSQRVLEFLIAQQDRFMLDIPPPPTRKQNVLQHISTTGTDDDAVLQSTDEELSGGWKLVGRDPSNVARRKTTVNGSGKSNIDFNRGLRNIRYCTVQITVVH